MVMKKVGIADLKSRLSYHLRGVRRGRTVTVMDRDTPIARIIPYERGPGLLVVRRPAPNAPRPGKVPLPKRLRVKVDILELLSDERQSER